MTVKVVSKANVAPSRPVRHLLTSPVATAIVGHDSFPIAIPVSKVTEQFEEGGATYQVTVETRDDEYYPTWHCSQCNESGNAGPSGDYQQAIADAQTNFRYHAAEHARVGPFQ